MFLLGDLVQAIGVRTCNLCLGAANSGLLKIRSIVGLTWIGKGLLMRRARDINRQAKGGGLKIWQN